MFIANWGAIAPLAPPDMPLAGFKIQIPKCNSLKQISKD